MDLNELNRKLKFRGKYVFAPATLLPFRRGAKKPYNFGTVEQLMARFPERLSMQTVELCEAVEAPDNTAHTATATFVVKILNGWCHGRFCDWVGIDDQTLDYFRYLDGRCDPRVFPFGRLNPRYWRQILSNPRRFPRPVQIEGRVLVLNKAASHNYFHWLSELLPRIDLVQQVGMFEADAYVVDCYKPFQRETLKLLGIPLERVIQPHNGLLIQADELIVPSFADGAARRRMRQQLRNTIKMGPASPGRRIYISRRHANNRVLANELQVSDLLQAGGFEIHHLEKFSFAEQIRLFHDTAVVVGLHGAGLTNLMLCQETTRLIEIRPSDCRRNCFPQLAAELGNPCQVVTAQRQYPYGPITCPLDHLQQAVERAVQGSGTK